MREYMEDNAVNTCCCGSWEGASTTALRWCSGASRTGACSSLGGICMCFCRLAGAGAGVAGIRCGCSFCGAWSFVTSCEFITGIIVNKWLGWHVWDYTGLPLQLFGQICVPFMLLFALPVRGWGSILGGLHAVEGLWREKTAVFPDLI